MLCAQKYEIACVRVKIGKGGNPERRIIRNAIYAGGRNVRSKRGKRLFQQYLVSKHVGDHSAFHINVPRPTTAIPLGRVPKSILHA